MSEPDLTKFSAQLDDLRNALRGWFCAILEQYPNNTKGTTVTDQTVPVPVDLLKRLFDNTTLTRGSFGDSVDVRPSGIGALIDIKALIPTPPKVGDALTATQVESLPRKAVVIDIEGDPWIADGEGRAYLFTEEEQVSVSMAYQPFTLVYLPEA